MVLRKIVAVSRHIEIQELARSAGSEIFVADDPAEAVDIISTVNPHLIISDGNSQADEMLGLLSQNRSNFNTPVLIVDADPIPCRKANNLFYLSDANDIEQFRQIISEIEKHGDSALGPRPSIDAGRTTNDEYFAEEIAASVSMAGKSRAILGTLKMLRLVAESRCNPVLITGETGTGKELAAKAVHNIRHPDKPFVAVNCAALTANLLESELFGHTRGSFTGADKEKTGLLELAGEGTIFLDEISEMPLELQAKLLRVLQEKMFRKVGGIADLECKATIIASSNRDLRKEVTERRFRQDLYYRLNICPVVIAPLRSQDRHNDIRLLAKFFLKNSTVCPGKAGGISAFTEMALERLEKHDWPGNVRELRNIVERAILLETTDKIGLSSIHIEQLDTDCFTAEHAPWNSENSRDKVLVPRGQRAETAERNNNLISANSVVSNFSLDKAERELIARALQESGWQKTKAASLLGITRATLYAKVKQHNIQKGTYIPVTSEEANLVSV